MSNNTQEKDKKLSNDIWSGVLRSDTIFDNEHILKLIKEYREDLEKEFIFKAATFIRDNVLETSPLLIDDFSKYVLQKSDPTQLCDACASEKFCELEKYCNGEFFKTNLDE